MYKVVSLFSGCGGADKGMVGDFFFINSSTFTFSEVITQSIAGVSL